MQQGVVHVVRGVRYEGGHTYGRHFLLDLVEGLAGCCVDVGDGGQVDDDGFDDL